MRMSRKHYQTTQAVNQRQCSSYKCQVRINLIKQNPVKVQNAYVRKWFWPIAGEQIDAASDHF